MNARHFLTYTFIAIFAASPTVCFARTYYCMCENSSNVLVDPEFKVQARNGIRANEKARNECKAKGYKDGHCYLWPRSSNDRTDSAEEFEQMIDLMLDSLE